MQATINYATELLERRQQDIKCPYYMSIFNDATLEILEREINTIKEIIKLCGNIGSNEAYEIITNKINSYHNPVGFEMRIIQSLREIRDQIYLN